MTSPCSTRSTATSSSSRGQPDPRSWWRLCPSQGCGSWSMRSPPVEADHLCLPAWRSDGATGVGQEVAGDPRWLPRWRRRDVRRPAAGVGDGQALAGALHDEFGDGLGEGGGDVEDEPAAGVVVLRFSCIEVTPGPRSRSSATCHAAIRADCNRIVTREAPTHEHASTATWRGTD
jgi:hypothetical protein